MLRDVCIIHKRDDWTEELPFALRSLRNLPHRKVWFVGHKPDWVVNVEHLPVEDITPKWHDIQAKYLAFIGFQGDMTGEVVSMYDDTYILDGRHGTDLPTFHWGTAKQAWTGGKNPARLKHENLENRALPTYRRSIFDSGRVLEEYGIEEPLNYSLHVPFVFDRPKVPTHLWDGGVLNWKTMAGNTSGRESTDLGGDVKVNRRVTLADALSRDTGFLSSLNSNFRASGVKRFLRSLFPEPCRYERAFYESG